MGLSNQTKYHHMCIFLCPNIQYESNYSHRINSFAARASLSSKFSREDLRKWMSKNDNSHKIDLDLLEQRRDHSLIRTSKHQAYTEQYYNNKMRVLLFKKRDPTLRNIEVVGHIKGHNKLSSNWEGPFILKVALGKNSYRFKDGDGKETPLHWSEDPLKKFFTLKLL